MQPPEEVKCELVRQWLGKAEEDLQVIAFMMDNHAPFYTVVAFHAQQAVEKYLKAWLTSIGIEFTKTHNISHLLSFVSQSVPELAARMESAGILSRYAVESRFASALLRRPAASVESSFVHGLRAGSALIGGGGRAHRRAGMNPAFGDCQGDGCFDFRWVHLSLDLCAADFWLITLFGI